jgi:hypothetical protein
MANNGAPVGVTATNEALWLLRYARDAAHPIMITFWYIVYLLKSGSGINLRDGRS